MIPQNIQVRQEFYGVTNMYDTDILIFPKGTCVISSQDLDFARKIPGTDEDILFIFKLKEQFI